MRRNPDPATESAARLFFLAILTGLLGILLSCYYAAGGFAPVDGVAELNEAILAVDGARVLKHLTVMNATGVPRGFAPGQHPLYVLTCIPEEETQEARDMVRQVAHAFSSVPVDVGYVYHPLTAAYRHHRYNVAKILLDVFGAHPPVAGAPMREVYASALSVAELREVDSSVGVYCEARDTFRCRSILHPNQIRNKESSQLESTYALVHVQPQTPPPRIPFRDNDVPRKVVAPQSTIRAGIWKDPFLPLLPDVLPPRGTLIVNPGYFSDPADQLLYMVFGHVEGSMLLKGFVLFALSLTSCFLAMWAVGASCWLLRLV